MNIRADDIWGNPTQDVDVRRLILEGSGPIGGLPASAVIPPNATSLTVEGLRAEALGEISVSIRDADKTVLARSNALAVAEQLALRPYWGDLHAQSGETIGSGSALDYMKFARDCAFLDMVGHQGNDFQITQEFWSRLNSLMRAWNEPGRFITVPGYEWSGTALGGDRNVFYRDENQLIRRSSHAPRCRSFGRRDRLLGRSRAFCGLGPEFSNTVVWAHCGGRYADIHYAHDHA